MPNDLSYMKYKESCYGKKQYALITDLECQPMGLSLFNNGVVG